ncbi:MAG: hypothetical protein AB1465_06350 [Patescibacteria group bacterium]
MQLQWHKNLTLERWQKFEKYKQILSIVVEFQRAESAAKRKNNNEVRLCYERAYELLDLTIEDPRWKHNLKELLRFREIFGELYLKPNLELNQKLYKILLAFNSKAYNLLI